MIQGRNNAFDGDGRLVVGGTAYQPGALTYSLADSGQTVVTAAGIVDGLTVSRKITVPNAGGEDFAQTVDSFTNSGGSPISTTVQILGNLGSDSQTCVFATSNGNTAVTPADQWIGTSNDNGTPAVIHYIHGPLGLQPATVAVIGDNITWTYDVTVPANQTVRLAYFTIVSSTRTGAIAAAGALVTSNWFGDQAGVFLTPSELASLANFAFPPPTVTGTSPTLAGGSLPALSTSLSINFSRPVVGAGLAANYQLQSSGPDGLLGTADDVITPLSVSYSGDTATLTFAPLAEQVYRLTVFDAITDYNGDPLQGSGGVTSNWTSDFVVVPSGSLAPVTLTSPHGMPFDIDVSSYGAGQLIQGYNNAFDGDGRLYVNGVVFQPATAGYTIGDSGHTVITNDSVSAGLTIQRQVAVPISGGYDLARTVDSFTNPSDSPLTVSVEIVGNLGSDANTTVFATSSGSTLFTPADQWIGTDDNIDGGGSPAIIHYVHGLYGEQPWAVNIINDNISWTYSLTVPAAGTVRLTYFTIVATTRSQAIAAADALATTSGFSDEAGTYLTPSQLGSMANFVFPGTTPPAISSTSPALTGGTLSAGVTSLEITFNKPVLGAGVASSYQLQSAGPDGLLGTADDVIIPITAYYRGSKATLTFAPLMEGLYRLTVHNTITNLAGNALQGANGGTGDWRTDFVVIPSNSTIYATPPFGTGGYCPESVAVRDFNGDGIPDVAAANANSSSIAILLGDGSGNFSLAGTYDSGGSSPVSLAMGDFNGDGNLDLAVADYDTSTVGILLGDGTGKFSTVKTFSCGGTNPMSIVAADFNGDGIIDLATANYGNSTIGIMLGHGNGTFATATTFSSDGSSPIGLAAGDFNGDGKVDLAATNASSNTVAVFRNSGTGSFSLQGSYDSGGQYPNSLAVGDFNGDGNRDLVVTNNKSGALRLLLNNGSGGFTAETPIFLGSDYPGRVTVGDFNRDGNLDVALTYGSDLVILWGNGAGGLSSPTMFLAPVSGPWGIAAADLNGDGNVDVVMGATNGSAVGVLLGDGKGGFNLPVSDDIASEGSGPRCVVSADFNHDGKPDLAIANESSETLGILLGNGDGTFTAAGSYSAGGSFLTSIAVGDFNSDGNLDLAVTNLYNGTIAILLGDGHGHFSPAATIAAGIANPECIETADLNGDGKLDLVVLNGNYGTTIGAVLLGNGNGAFSTPKTFNTGGTPPVGMIITDFNGDGKPDLIVANTGNGGIGTLGIDLGDGAGNFTLAATLNVTGLGMGIVAGDFNNDGLLDVAVGVNNSSVGVFFGNGQGGFTNSSPVVYSALVNETAMVAGDFNGDGNLDLAVVNMDGSAGILLNNGDGTFLPIVDYNLAGLGPAGVTAADFNGDGKLDLAETNWASDSVGILSNIGGPAPITRNSPNGLPFDIAVGEYGAGQLVQGSNNAFDGDGRLIVGGQAFHPTLLNPTIGDSGRSVFTGSGTAAGLTVSRRITVPNTGSQDFARTIDSFTNPTSSPITTTVQIIGNLGSDAATTVFATSDGTGVVSPNDEWIGTDDPNAGSGVPAVIHIIYGPRGLTPTSESVIGDNITWTYSLTVPAGQTVELGYFTIVNAKQAGAIAAANALVTGTGFGGHAADYLSSTDLSSLENFYYFIPTALAFTTGPVAGTYGGSTSATACLTVGGQPLSNEVLTFLVNGAAAGTATTDDTGTAGLANISLAGIHVGVDAGGLSVKFAGDATRLRSSAAADITVNQAPLTVTADNQTSVYGSTLPTFTVHYTGLVNGDTAASLATQPTITTTATTASNVGSYPITASGAADADYAIVYVGGTLSVTPAPLTITADNQTSAYGATLPTLTAQYSGFVNGDTSASLATQPTIATTATTASNVGSYPISASEAADADYTIVYVGGTLSVTPVPLTITADNQTSPYGVALPALTVHYSGFVNGDTLASLTRQPSVTTSAMTTSHVSGNPYTTTARGAIDANYTISYVGGTLSITPAPLTITADNQTSVYGAALPALTVHYSGFVNGRHIGQSHYAACYYHYRHVRQQRGQLPDYGRRGCRPGLHDQLCGWEPERHSRCSDDHGRQSNQRIGAALPALTVHYSGFVNGDTSASLTTQPTVATTATAASYVGIPTRINSQRGGRLQTTRSVA